MLMMSGVRLCLPCYTKGRERDDESLPVTCLYCYSDIIASSTFFVALSSLIEVYIFGTFSLTILHSPGARLSNHHAMTLSQAIDNLPSLSQVGQSGISLLFAHERPTFRDRQADFHRLRRTVQQKGNSNAFGASATKAVESLPESCRR